MKKKIIEGKDMSNKRRNPFYLTAFKHSYKPKIKGDMVDLVAVAKKALEKRRKDEQIEKAVKDNAFVNEYVQNNHLGRNRTKSNDKKDR